MSSLPTYADVLAAAERVKGIVHRTPVLTSRFFDDATGAQVFFKCENFQRVGAFKFRGAVNAVNSLSDAAAAKGVITHSSGNHGQAIALAAKLRGIKAIVVMPNDTTPVKVDAVRGYGAEVHFCEPGTANRQRAADEIVARTGAVLVHPNDHDLVIAGQGTAALELLEDQPDLDFVVTPVGGGGLISGTALAVKGKKPSVQVVGAEPEQAADAAASLKSGAVVTITPPKTIADGLRSASLGVRNFPLVTRHVSDILTVSEREIVEALGLVLARMKIVIEPSSAVAVAALLKYAEKFAGRQVGVILSGGNVDVLPLLSQFITS